MHLSSILTPLAALSTLSSAFVIDIYDSTDCSGPSRNVNVWDNSCATWMGGFSSYMPRVYGGSHQKAYFFAPSNCGNLATNLQTQWADGGGFQVNQCYNFGGSGHVANAASSYSS